MGRATLFLMVGFFIIFGMIQRSVQNNQQTLTRRTPNYFYAEQSKNIAASMMEIAIGNYNNNYQWPGNLTKNNFMGGKGTISVDSTAYFGSRIYLSIKGIMASSFSDKETITTIKAVANRPAFSIYAYFTDIEPNIDFVTGDILHGPVHTNGTFHIAGNPVFNGKVTSPHTPIGYGSPTFNKGSDFNAGEIELPTEAPDAVKLAKKKNGGIGQFDSDIYVEFKDGDPSKNNDGTVEISKPRQGCILHYQGGQCAAFGKLPDANTTVTHKLSDFNDVISSKGNVYVKGKIDGQVTLHSVKNVDVMGDVEYANRNYKDQSQPISDDRLGIVSNNNTIINKYAQYDHENLDINIDASVLTLNGSFQVEDYGKTVFGQRNRGKINLLGGVIQKTRGPVGTHGYYGMTGYTKNYIYDSRFQTNSTPGFPKIKRFEINSWRESTTVKKK